MKPCRIGRHGRPAQRGRALRWGLAALAVAFTASCGGDDLPSGAKRVDELSEVGDCLGPDPDDAEKFVQRDCGDPRANVKIIEMIGPSFMPFAGEPNCPGGTDAMVEARQGPVHDGRIGVLSQPSTWCLRNLRPPHPGDPGMGGGQLRVDDCFVIATSGSINEEACAGGTTPPKYRLVDVVSMAADCPPSGTEPIRVGDLPPKVLCGQPV